MSVMNNQVKGSNQEGSLFEAVVENSLDAIGIADLEGYVIYANRACYELFGWD